MEINLLVVDDEVQIRAGIEKGIRWRELGITKVRSAPNGVEALEIIKAGQADILITDIRMPGMDGLELARKAKEEQENIHIIILSGFSEFEYAKQAISIGVKNYLLKPIKVKELTDNVAGIVRILQEEADMESLKRRQEEEQALARYILLKNQDENVFLKLIKEYADLNKEDKILCVLLEPDTRDTSEESTAREGLSSLLKEEAENHQFDFVISLSKRILYVARMDLSRSRQDVICRVQKLVQEYNSISKEKKQSTISAAVYRNCSVTGLTEAVDSCIQLLNKRLCLGVGVVIPFEENTIEVKKNFYIENEEEIRQYIISFQYDEAQQFIARHFRKMKELGISSYDLVKGVCLTLKQLLFRYIRETGVDAEMVLEKNQNVILEVPDLFTIEEYENWICNLYYLVLKGVSEHTDRNVSNTVMAAVAYISTHYQEELTVDELSSYVNKSKNYFSYLFKKEMKVSFVEYLNRYRVEQACTFLETTLELAGEIGMKVGFKDEKYFSAVFKKVMGCSPSHYRKNRGMDK